MTSIGRNWLAAFALVCLATPAAQAETRGGGDYSYVSGVEGGATVVQAGGTRSTVRRNLPLSTGDTLDASSGRVETRLADGTLLFLERGARVRLDELANTSGGNDDVSRIALEDGSIAFYVDPGAAELRVDTDVASAYLAPGGRYRVDVVGDEETQIIVLEGSASVVTRDGEESLEDGEMALVEEGRDPYVTSYRGGDSFDRWVEGRADTATRQESRYVSGALTYESSMLNDHGSWNYLDDYSTYGWRPRGVSSSWRPYSHGSWYQTNAGLSWNSHEAWGWAPYHYGNWVFSSRYGWIWIPGQNYSPAWVYWYSDPWSVGWCPMGYYDVRYRNRWDYYGNRYGYGGYGGGWGGYRSGWNGLSININIGNFDHRPWNWMSFDDFRQVDRYGDVNSRLRPFEQVRDRARRGGEQGVIIAEPLPRAPREMRSHRDIVDSVAPRQRTGTRADATPYFGREGTRLDRRTEDALFREKPVRTTGDSIRRMRERGVRLPDSSTARRSRDGAREVSNDQVWRAPQRTRGGGEASGNSQRTGGEVTRRAPRSSAPAPEADRQERPSRRSNPSTEARPSRDTNPSAEAKPSPSPSSDWRERSTTRRRREPAPSASSNERAPSTSSNERSGRSRSPRASESRQADPESADSNRQAEPEERQSSRRDGSVARRVLDGIDPSTPRVTPSREREATQQPAARSQAYEAPRSQRQPRAESAPRSRSEQAPRARREESQSEKQPKETPPPSSSSSSRRRRAAEEDKK